MTAKLSDLPLVSIIIPCRNEEKHISGCLDSVLQNEYPVELQEIIIVDGASEDRSVEIIKKYIKIYPHIRLLNNPEKITPKSLNKGILSAKGSIIIRMDVHSYYDKYYISTLVYYLSELKCDNVGGVWEILPGNNSITATAIAYATSSPFGIGNAWYRIGVSKIREVDTVPFGCYRKEIFDKIGLFDEELVKNQDDEFNARLIKNGGKIFLIPSAKIKYYARESIKEIVNMFYFYGFYKPLVNIKIKRISTLRQLIPPAFIILLTGLSVLAFINKIFLVPLIIVCCIYFLTNLLFSLVISVKKEKIRMLPALFILFPAIHVTYGISYLIGLIYHPIDLIMKKIK